MLIPTSVLLMVGLVAHQVEAPAPSAPSSLPVDEDIVGHSSTVQTPPADEDEIDDEGTFGNAPELAPANGPGEAPPAAPPLDGAAPTKATVGAVGADSPAPSPEVLRVAIADFRLDGVDNRLGRIVTDAILKEVRKLRRVSAIGFSEVREMLELEATKAAAGCDEDESCLAEIADALGVDVLLTGTLAVVGSESVFGLRRLEQSSAQVSQQYQERLRPAGGEEFLAAIGPAIEQLFPDRELRPGQTRGVSPELARLLSPPPLPLWSFTSAAIGTGALAAAAVLVGGAFAALRINYEMQLNAAKQDGVRWAELEQQQPVINTTLVVAGVLVVAAAGAGAGTGVMALFTDWYGAGDVED
jgi:hypothetical protein